MKLMRIGPAGRETPAIVDRDGIYRDLSGYVADIAGDALTPDRLAEIGQIDLGRLPILSPEARIGACVGGIGKFICIGLNYADHAAETGAEIPDEPVIFMKATSAVCGPNDSIIQPRGSTKLDWEVELGVVIGAAASYVSERDASSHIAGFCVVHDVSERQFQLERGGQWDKGKGCDTFGPIGPWLVTPDEIKDVTALNMWLDVNSQPRQRGSTQTMIFKPDFLVSYVSQFMSLQPGDIISTGTPPGVGMGRNPPQYLKPGDTIRLGIDGLGEQRQTVVAPSV